MAFRRWTENSAGMLVLRAALRMAQEDPNTARRDATAAVRLATQDLATASRVLEDLNTVFATPEETARFILQQDLTALPGRGKDYFRAIAMMQLTDRLNRYKLWQQNMLRDYRGLWIACHTEPGRRIVSPGRDQA